MGDHRDRELRKAYGLQVEDLVKTLRSLERDLVTVLSERKAPARLRDLADREDYDDYTFRDPLDEESDAGDSSASDGMAGIRRTGTRDDRRHRRCDHRPAPCRTQFIISGALTVPCEKPDIESVLRFLPVCKVTHWEPVETVDGRKIVVSGVAEIGVEYVANLPDQPLHFAHFTQPFHTFFLCDKEIEEVRCEVEFTHHELLSARCISEVVLLAVRGV